MRQHIRDVYWELAAWPLVFRRWYYMLFRKAYVRAMLARRKGVCGAHGCCFHHLHHRLLHRRCTDPSNRNRCLKWDRLPEACRIYPFDETDKNPRTRPFCNFYWE